MRPWTYDQGDPSVQCFTLAMDRWAMPFWAEDRILELGCAETDWIERMLRWDPTYQITGVDWNVTRDPLGWALRRASALEADLFPPASFDWVVLLGALEHFGLGYYGDPLDEDGDTRTMQNIVQWLRPGGSVYFDVPCNPTYEVTANRHFRIYDPAALRSRLLVPGLVERGRFYTFAEPQQGVFDDPPVEARVPYHYGCCWWQKGL